VTDTDWLALADFLDAHANDMRAWTEDEPKFRAAADGLRQLAAITAERDQLRELAGFLIDACATHRIDVPINSSLLDLAADIAGGGVLAAADRGVTDGETSVVDAYEASHNRHMGRPH
jgi:hypothetical protein